MKIAVIAHFDANNVWDENFLSILSIASEVVDRSYVITTSKDIGPLPLEFSEVSVVRRPNIGYDYYSYKVGVYLAMNSGGCSGLLLINSSFLLLNTDRFRSLLLDITSSDRTTSVRGLTESFQFGWHLQSFLLYFDFDTSDSLNELVVKFFQSVEPVNTKLDYILNYELKLGAILKRENISTESLFKPSIANIVAGSIKYHSILINKAGLWAWFTQNKPKALRNINWTHFGAVSIARMSGIVKSELLRDNPHQLSNRKIWDICTKEHEAAVNQSINRTRQHYQKNIDGTTVYSNTTRQNGLIKEVIVSFCHRKAHSKIAVVAHLFYFDLIDEIFDYIKNIIEPYDLYVTTPFEADVSKILDIANLRNQNVTVVFTHNKGRDVGPFIALYRTGILDTYRSVLKIHSKKSLYAEIGREWREQLFKLLCGSSLTVFRSLKLLSDEGCGIVGPTGFFLTDSAFWGANEKNVKLILSGCGIDTDASAPTLSFFAGTMFWFSPTALKAIHECNDDLLIFEEEDGRLDGTLAHAWERTFCLIAKAAGYSVSTNELNGKDITECIPESSRIHPVINFLDRTGFQTRPS